MKLHLPKGLFVAVMAACGLVQSAFGADDAWDKDSSSSYYIVRSATTNAINAYDAEARSAYQIKASGTGLKTVETLTLRDNSTNVFMWNWRPETDLNLQVKELQFGQDGTGAGSISVNANQVVTINKVAATSSITSLTNAGTLSLGAATVGTVTNTGTLNIHGTMTGTGTNSSISGTVNVVVNDSNICSYDGVTYSYADESTPSGKSGFIIDDQNLTVFKDISYTGATVTVNGEAATLQNGVLTYDAGDDKLFFINDAWAYNASQSAGATSYHVTSNGTMTFDVQAEGPTTLSEVLAGAGSVKKTGAGTLTLSGANTYSGGTTIESGTLTITHKSALGTGTVVVGENATLETKVTGKNNQALYGIAGVTLKTGATLKNSGGDNWADTPQLTVLTLEGDASVDAAAHLGLVASSYAATTLNLKGHTLTKKGTGNFALLSTNVIGGGTIDITAGNVLVGHSAMATTLNAEGTIIKLDAGKLALENSGSKAIIDALTGTGGTIQNAGTIELKGTDSYSFAATVTGAGSIKVTGTGTHTYTGSSLANSIELAANSGFEFASDTDVAYAKILSGSGEVIKTGTGTLTLSGANTYTGGTTIEKGILALSGNGTLGTGLVTIKKDGTLKTNGSTATMTVTGAGAIDLGSSTTLNATLDSNWTGTVKMSGATLANANLNDYGNAGSTVQISSMTGSMAAQTVNTKVVFDGSNGAAFNWTDTDGTANLTFSQKVIGNGNIAFGQGGQHSIAFTGDVSGWEGVIWGSRSEGMSITYSGQATEINHQVRSGVSGTAGVTNVTYQNKSGMVVNGAINTDTDGGNDTWARGVVNLKVQNEAGATGEVVFNGAISNNSNSGATNLTVGEGASAKFTNANVKLTNVTMEEGASLAITTAKTLTFQNLTLADGTTINPKAAATLVDAAEATTNVSITVSKKASFGEGATINADLTLANGATVEMADAPLTLGGTLTLNKGLTLEEGGLLTTIMGFAGKTGTQKQTLFIVAGLNLVGANALTTAAEVGISETKVAFSDYFTNDVTTETGDYYLGYDGSNVYVEFVAKAEDPSTPEGGGNVPEPTTGALSLLGLAALAMRRRRRA